MSEISAERMKEIAEQLGINLREGETVSEEMLQEFLHEGYSDEDRVE